jgi:hypothetical protein
MSAKENTAQAVSNQPKSAHKNPPDLRKANDLEASILHDLEFSVRFARLAYEHSDIFDHQGFVFSLEKYLDHARNVSSKLKELRKVRGVTQNM